MFDFLSLKGIILTLNYGPNIHSVDMSLNYQTKKQYLNLGINP